MRITMKSLDGEMKITRIRANGIPALVLRPVREYRNVPGIVWIHGGGYITGVKEMALVSRAAGIVKKYGAVVISPGYRRAVTSPYPAAIEDCYKVLLYMKEHAEKLGVRNDQIMVGGESAGGGLAAALSMMARDRGEVRIAYQMPLYPMIDNHDTDSSRDNHGKAWDTRRNHLGWHMYLRGDFGKDVSPYASPARQDDYRGLPPCYTFVGDGEPFYDETLSYVKNLKDAGIEAEVDVYHTDIHAFDLLRPDLAISKEAEERFNRHFEYARDNYFAPQD